MFQNNLNPIPQQNSIQGFPSQPQSFPPQVPQQSYPPNMGNPMPQQKGFFSKMNSATDGFIQFIKSKTPMVSAQGLLNSPTLNLEPINKETFQELQTKNIKEVECGKITKTVLNDVTVISKIINPRTVEKGFFESNFVLYDIASNTSTCLIKSLLLDLSLLSLKTLKEKFARDKDNKIHLLLEYTGDAKEIIDPWYYRNFDECFTNIYKGCESLYNYIITERK